jgi:hypothetical protein
MHLVGAVAGQLNMIALLPKFITFGLHKGSEKQYSRRDCKDFGLKHLPRERNHLLGMNEFTGKPSGRRKNRQS